MLPQTPFTKNSPPKKRPHDPKDGVPSLMVNRLSVWDRYAVATVVVTSLLKDP